MRKQRNTKGRIIAAAWRLFYEHGYDNTTIDEILLESNTSRGTFYHYFKGKDALLGNLSTCSTTSTRSWWTPCPRGCTPSTS